MSLTADQLYALLPAIYRTRDAAVGGPLQALTVVLAEQLSLVDDATQQLYADQFIETCATWAIPYLGDLIGVNPIHDVDGARYSSRAEVGNTIGYRRRKGTLLAIEQLAADISGRGAAAVESFRHLITTESMRLIRPVHRSTLSLRSQNDLEKLDTAFDLSSRTIDVRRIAPRNLPCLHPDPTPLDVALHGGGRFNIPDLALYLWRWKTNRLQNAPAFVVDKRRFLCSMLGQDLPLFNLPADRQSFQRLTTRYDVAQPIRRRELAKDTARFYSPEDTLNFTADGSPISGRASISIALDGIAVPLAQICAQNLSDRADGSWNCTPARMVGIDPELGRIQLGSSIAPPAKMTITYCYGTPAYQGGGPYDRSANLTLPAATGLTLNRAVSSSVEFIDAIAAWNALPPGSTGLIVLANILTLDMSEAGAGRSDGSSDGNTIQLSSASTLTIVSASLAATLSAPPILNESLAVLTGNLHINAPFLPADQLASPPSPGMLILNGIWLSGHLQITGGPSTIALSDCTLVPGIALNRSGEPLLPGQPSVLIDSVSSTLSLESCITGPILAPIGNAVRIACSIVDAGSPCALAYAAPDRNAAGADLHIEDSTVLGKMHLQTLTLASNTIFSARLGRRDTWPAALWCDRRQTGCMRFCWLPTPAITPSRYECLPPSADEASALEPRFITVNYGSPSFCLLSGDTPVCILNGASDSGEIGVYNSLQEWQAFRNVQIRASEYLPFSLEAGIFLVPSRVERGAQADRFQYGKPRNPANPCGDEEEVWLDGIGVALI